MFMRSALATKQRAGMTLVEMMVVLMILAILLALTAVMVPRFGDGAKAREGTDKVLGTLLLARQRAVRDQRDTGVRLIGSGNYATELQFIQRPDDLGSGTATPGDPNICTFADLTIGSGPPTVISPKIDLSLVLPGDYLEVAGGGLLHRITSVNVGASQCVCLTKPDGGTTSNFRIIRQPRPLAGQPSVQLPLDVAIVKGSAAPYNLSGFLKGTTFTSGLPANPDTGNIDILFAPSGAIVGRGTTTVDQLILWVCETSVGLTEGGPMLVAINVRTGLIAAVPVDIGASGDYYNLAKDPRLTGM